MSDRAPSDWTPGEWHAYYLAQARSFAAKNDSLLLAEHKPLMLDDETELAELTIQLGFLWSCPWKVDEDLIASAARELQCKLARRGIRLVAT